MAANTTPIFPAGIINDPIAFTNATGTTAVTCVTAGTNGTRIDAIGATSTDTVARYFNVLLYNGSTTWIIGEVNIPASAGQSSGAVLPVSVLNSVVAPWIDSTGSIYLASGYQLQFALKTSAVTSGDQINFFAFGGNY